MDWFLIKKNEHLGPFSEEILRQMYAKGELNDQSQLWREGLDSSTSFSHAFLESATTSASPQAQLPPDLPPIPTEEEYLLDTGQLEEVGYEQDLAEVEENHETAAKRSFKGIIISVLVLLVIGAALAFSFFNLKNQSFNRPERMAYKDFERLKQTALSDNSKVRFSFALGKSKKSFWVATNIYGEGEVTITLKSVKDKTLGGPVEVRASGLLRDKLITVDKFEFVQGTRIIDGVYAARIQTVRPLETPFYVGIVGHPWKTIDFESKVLISNLKKKDFQKQLARYLKRKRSNSKLFWEELVQKYQTVKMIAGQIRSGLEKVFQADPLKWKNGVALFENEYKTRYGIFFTEFVKNNEKNYNKISKKDFENSQEVLAGYNHLSKLATEIGETSMVILEELAAHDPDKNTPDERELLKTKTMSKLDEIIQGCEEKINQLSNN